MPPAVVTVMSTVPADSVGLVTTIWVAESLTIVPAVLPKSTAEALARLAPQIVTVVPPATGPVIGLTCVTVTVIVGVKPDVCEPTTT